MQAHSWFHRTALAGLALLFSGSVIAQEGANGLPSVETTPRGSIIQTAPPVAGPVVQYPADMSGGYSVPAGSYIMPDCGGTMMGDMGMYMGGGSQGFADSFASRPVDAGMAHFTVNLPEKAKLKVNDLPTKAEGTTRFFVVRRLEPGETYKFVFVAEIENAAGVKLEEKVTREIQAGAAETITLDPWQLPEPPAEEKKEEEKPAAGAVT